jgi:hypothetical protein
MTSSVHDYAAIRESLAVGQPFEPGSLAELIAEEKAAWTRQCVAMSAADEPYFAWRMANPAVDRDDDMPAGIAALYEVAKALVEPAKAATDRVGRFIPENLVDAIRLLEFAADSIIDRPEIGQNVAAGLRIIASAPVAPAPVTGDQRIIGLFRQWADTYRWYAELPDDKASEKAFDRLMSLREALSATEAEGITGLAVKLFLLLFDKNSFLGVLRPADPCGLAPIHDDEFIDPEMAISGSRTLRGSSQSWRRSARPRWARAHDRRSFRAPVHRTIRRRAP